MGHILHVKCKGCVPMENTLVIIKPDGCKKKLIGRIISMYEENGLSINGMYMTCLDEKRLKAHYLEHIGKDFFPSLMEYMMGDLAVVMRVSGENAINVVRAINGSTNPILARPGTIRYLFGENIQKNVVHGSGSREEASKELNIWFK